MHFFYFVWPIFRWCLCSKPCLFTSWMGVLKTTSNDLTPNSFWNWHFGAKEIMARNTSGIHMNVPWMFHGFPGNSPGNARIPDLLGPGTEKLPDLWFGISGWLLIPRRWNAENTTIPMVKSCIRVNYRYMLCCMWVICSHIYNII